MTGDAGSRQRFWGGSWAPWALPVDVCGLPGLVQGGSYEGSSLDSARPSVRSRNGLRSRFARTKLYEGAEEWSKRTLVFLDRVDVANADLAA